MNRTNALATFKVASAFVFFGTLCITTRTAWCDELSFNRDIRPILSDACFFCHGPDSAHREADLRLDVESDAKAHAIVPGDVEASELVARIISDDADQKMPPLDSTKKLTKRQIDLLKQWVQQGAKYEEYWAYVAPKPHTAPAVSRPDWPRDPVDQFVLAGLDQQGMKPAADADPITLIRRVTFDLTGLPPSEEQLQAFVANPSPAAYRRYVDKLLASPAYGERMAIYWLDLVRFADTVGYHGDQDHSISPYRDYVIDAFNRNLPLDQFAREQLAGDLLDDPTQDQLIASGYNRLLQTSHEGGVQPKEYLAIYSADRVRNFSEVWMGATVGCAQCHDHKYDPYTAKDFYSMAAFFADIDEAQHFKSGSNSLPTKRFPEVSVLSRWQRELLSDVTSDIERLEKIEKPTRMQTLRLADSKAVRDRLVKSKRVTMVSKTTQPREIRVLPRGNWLDDSGPVVQPTTPEFMKPTGVADRRANRLDLANWLTDNDTGVAGLTARVFANRFWYLLFGRGISSSLSDFGGQGQPPTHPELLDQLAIDFIVSDWNVKKLMRRLVLSRTYQQSSIVDEAALQADPYNEWFARQSRFRLPAEMVRDNTLSISGLLVSHVGGDSVKPYQPAGYYRHLNFPTRKYKADTGDRQWRRGVYTHWQRQFLHPMLKAMDAPSREECTAQRPRSNTPLEALVLLNDPSMVEAARKLAGRLVSLDGATEQTRIETGFRLATSRQPDAKELSVLSELLATEKEHYQTHRADAVQLLGSGKSLSQDDVVHMAAWVSVARSLLNMYETVTRN